MAASTASMSAPQSRPSEAAPAPGETFEQPGPFARQSLGSLLMASLRLRMPAASGDPTVGFPLGKDPRPLTITFLTTLYGANLASRPPPAPCACLRDAHLPGPPPAEAIGCRRPPTENTLLVRVKFSSFAPWFRIETDR